MVKKYFTEEERKNAQKEAQKRWYQKNIERERGKNQKNIENNIMKKTKK